MPQGQQYTNQYGGGPGMMSGARGPPPPNGPTMANGMPVNTSMPNHPINHQMPNNHMNNSSMNGSGMVNHMGASMNQMQGAVQGNMPMSGMNASNVRQGMQQSQGSVPGPMYSGPHSQSGRLAPYPSPHPQQYSSNKRQQSQQQYNPNIQQYNPQVSSVNFFFKNSIEILFQYVIVIFTPNKL